MQGPLALAAALTPKQAPEEGKPRPAVVVVGNSAFASNGFINFVGNSVSFNARSDGSRKNATSFRSHQKTRGSTVHAQPLQERILLYVQVIFLPAMTVLCGLLVWREAASSLGHGALLADSTLAGVLRGLACTSTSSNCLNAHRTRQRHPG